MSVVDKIKHFISTKRVLYKGLRIFKPSMYHVHPEARVKIEKYLNFTGNGTIQGWCGIKWLAHCTWLRMHR